MGGIATRPVVCSAYTSADAVDTDIENYIMNGVLPEAEYMLYYSWWFWAMYIWNLDLFNYVTAITEIMDCSIANGVEGTRYGNSEFYDAHWKPILALTADIFGTLDFWWFPLVYWFVSLTGLGELIMFILNFVYMFQFSESITLVFTSMYDAANKGNGEEVVFEEGE